MEKESLWKKSLVWKLLFISLISWAVLALVFGFLDLQISISIVDNTNPFGIFGADYGEGPGWGIFGVALVVLIGSAFSNVNRQKIPGYILMGIAIVALVVGFIIDSEDLLHYGGFIGFSILGFVIFTKNHDWRKYRNLALIVVLLFVINPALFVTGTKPLFGRVRFRNLTPPLYPEYTPWFAPPWLDLENLSFPSGHTAMGWMLLPLMIPLRNKEIWIKITGSVLILGWGFFVGFSRILVGAHYASDVLFSTGVAVVVVILLYKKYYLK